MFELFDARKKNIKDDVLSGLTVALALIPEAIAFAFVAGVSPIIGLHAAFMMGIITAVLGGRPGMISGATGAIAVVLATLVGQYGREYLFATVLLMGLFQMLAGFLRLGKFARMIPHPVMLGFVNGLAIVIFKAQLGQFKSAGSWIVGTEMLVMLGLVILTMAIITFLPKLTKVVPSTLVAIILVSVIAVLLNSNGIKVRNVKNFLTDKQKEVTTKNVKDEVLDEFHIEKHVDSHGKITLDISEEQNLEINTIIVERMKGKTFDEGISGGLPKFSIPKVDFNLNMLKIIFPFALIAAMVGLIESLLTLELVDELTDTRGRSNKECVAQGLGNVVNGLFGGMGGCAMIGQSMINIKSGGRTRISGIVAAISLLLFVLIGGPIIEIIPLAALVGVMFMVVIGTFEWETLKYLKKVPLKDVAVIIIVTVITVLHDLAVAVLIGIVISALIFVWEKGKQIYADTKIDENGVKIYKIRGSVFFASIKSFKDIFNYKEDPKNVIIDFERSRVMDHSAIEAINSITEKYKENGTKLILRHLSKDCLILLENAKDIIEVNIEEDPKYYVADDKLA